MIHAFWMNEPMGVHRVVVGMLFRLSVAAMVLMPALAIADSADRADPIEAWLDEARVANDIPGVSAVVVSGGEMRFAGGSGLADIAHQEPMTADSVLYIGSISKVLTAILTLNLVESGELSMDDRVGLVVNAPRDKPVLVEHLLAHSAGLGREGDFGYWFTADFPDNDALERWLTTTTLRSAPGARLHYSNTGYAALGLVIERTLDRTFEQALTARVLEPLGMTNTGARGPAPDIVKGYTPRGRILPSAARPFAGVGAAVDGRHERQYHDARAMSPAFGAWSSANDMGRLIMFLLGHEDEHVLSAEMRLRMRERQSTGRGLGFKLGEVDGRQVARHDGWFAAHRTHLLLDADSGVGVVVLANSDNASARELADELYRFVLTTLE